MIICKGEDEKVENGFIAVGFWSLYPELCLSAVARRAKVGALPPAPCYNYGTHNLTYGP
jgi:hypothetical protein